MHTNLSLDSELRSIFMIIHMRGVNLPSFGFFFDSYRYSHNMPLPDEVALLPYLGIFYAINYDK